MVKEALEGCLEADISQGSAIPLPVYTEGIRNSCASYRPVPPAPGTSGELSQTDIARNLGLSYQSYQRLENPRKANPTIKTLERTARVYGRELTISI